MRRLGYQWRDGELGYAVRYWTTIVGVYLVLAAALGLVAWGMF